MSNRHLQNMKMCLKTTAKTFSTAALEVQRLAPLDNKGTKMDFLNVKKKEVSLSRHQAEPKICAQKLRLVSRLT